jgi:hypothetical protein
VQKAKVLPCTLSQLGRYVPGITRPSPSNSLRIPTELNRLATKEPGLIGRSAALAARGGSEIGSCPTCPGGYAAWWRAQAGPLADGWASPPSPPLPHSRYL